MAGTKKSSSKSVSVVLASPQVKKSVTRFDATAENPALANAYISNDALKTLGNPERVTVTITAA